MTSAGNTTPRHRVVGHIYDQAVALGIDWRLPCDPGMNDLCERGELAGVVPVVTYLPSSDAEAVFDGRAFLVLSEEKRDG